MMRPAECDLGRALFYAIEMRNDGITEIRIALAAVGCQQEGEAPSRTSFKPPTSQGLTH